MTVTASSCFPKGFKRALCKSRLRIPVARIHFMRRCLYTQEGQKQLPKNRTYSIKHSRKVRYSRHEEHACPTETKFRAAAIDRCLDAVLLAMGLYAVFLSSQELVSSLENRFQGEVCCTVGDHPCYSHDLCSKHACRARVTLLSNFLAKNTAMPMPATLWMQLMVSSYTPAQGLCAKCCSSLTRTSPHQWTIVICHHELHQ